MGKNAKNCQIIPPPKKRSERLGNHEIEPLTLFLYVLVFYLTFLMTVVLMNRGSDFTAHTELALETVRFSQPLHVFEYLSYPIWHILVAGVYRFFRHPVYSAAFVSASFNLFTTAVIYRVLKRFLSDKFSANHICFITFILTFVTAIWIPWFSPHIYLGPLSPTIWHNPTNNAVKGISIIIFYLFIDIFLNAQKAEKDRMPMKQMALLSFLLLISTLLKPSFIILFIPAAFLFLLIELIRVKGKNIVFCMQTALACLPSLIPLFYSYYLTYIKLQSDLRGGVVFSFLTAISTWTTNIPLTVMLPFIFPMFVIMLNYKNIYQNKPLFFAMMTAFVGALYWLCFAESNQLHANELAWVQILALILIWLVTIIDFFSIYHRDRHSGNRLRKNLISMGFVLVFMHFFTGIYYYIRLLFFAAGQC